MDINKILEMLGLRTPVILGSERFLKFAVLIPLIKKEDDIHVLFEIRSQNLRRQPGEICFPGGKVDDQDKNTKYTAIRETTEELRICDESITEVTPLDYIVTPFGTMIYPFVGLIDPYEKINPNPSEVEEVFTVPLSFFKQTKPDIYKIQFKIEPEPGFPYELIAGGENYKWQIRGMDEYFYHYEGKVIWGLTARILTHFLELVEEIKGDKG